MVPVMSGWTLQKKGYDPAALNVRAPVSPCPRFSVVHAGSSLRVAVCGTPSPFVQAITSPTFAWTVPGEKAFPVMAAWTVPGSVDGAHDPAPVPASVEAADGEAAAETAGSGVLAPAVPAGVAGEQAASKRTAATARAIKMRVMGSSRERIDPSGVFRSVYVATVRAVSEGAVR